MTTEMRDSSYSGKTNNHQRQDSDLSSEKSLSRIEWMRALTLRQWRHGDPVKNPVRNIHHAGDFIDKLLEEIGVSGEIEQKQLEDAWASVAGDFIAKNSKPESLKNGVLVVRVVQPALRFQLEQMKGKLLNNLKRELVDIPVKTIVLKV